MIAASWRFVRLGKRASHHDRICAAGQRLANVPASAHPAIGNDGHVSRGFFEVSVARCRAIDRLRFDQRKKRNNTYPDSLLPTTDIVDPQQAAIFKEESRRLETALDVLTPHERQAIEAAFFSELTYAEVAQKLNQPLGTVKTRIRSGLAKLREALGKEEAR